MVATTGQHRRPSMIDMVMLTPNERRLLVQLINIMEATEWSEGDYNLTQRQHDSLQNAKAKLEK